MRKRPIRRLELPGGTVYEGEVQDEAIHGHGKLTMADGSVYTGQWERGNHHGTGKLELPTGYVYDGEWLHGKKHGQGQMWHEGLRYVGAWEDGRQHGTGTMHYANGDSYTGDWSAGLPHGQGMMIRKSGDYIYGHWANGKKLSIGSQVKHRIVESVRWLWQAESARGLRFGIALAILVAPFLLFQFVAWVLSVAPPWRGGPRRVPAATTQEDLRKWADGVDEF